MDIGWIESVCLGLPHVAESIQWEHSLVFKVGGKMFAVAALEPGRTSVAFKCSADDFATLTERPGIIPAPYLARAQWVAVEDDDALSARELEEYLRRAYDFVRAKLPAKVREALS